jgi:selenocysteine lyase/cysteine desulfurase
MKVSKIVTAFRRQFPHLRGRIYFNHGAASVPPTSVIRAAAEGVKLALDYSLNPATQRKWSLILAETRAMAAELIGAAPANVAFVANTSTALSLISQAIPWKRGDNVVTATVENPANVVPWQNMRHLGIEVRYLPADKDDLVDLAALPKYLDKRTRLVALSLVGYATGQRLDLKRVVRLCRPRRILVSADAVQAVGAVPVDVKALGVDFLAYGVQKWVMGLRHVGVLYAGDEALRRTVCPIVTESSVADIGAEEEEPTRGAPHLKAPPGALKFEAVPYSNFAGICALRQALLNIRAVGKENLYARVREITSELVAGLEGLGGRVISPRGDSEWSGIVSYAPDGAAPKEIVARLAEMDVHVRVRKGRIRICPHWYNISAEVRKFLAALRTVVARASHTAPYGSCP